MELCELAAPSESILEQVHHIYEVSFPASQRMPFRRIRRSIAKSWRRLFVALDDTSQCLAFAVTVELPRSQCILLEYFAVREEERSRGVGSKMLSFLRDTLMRDRSGSELILEVDAGECSSIAEAQEQKNRIAFYERNGASFMDSIGMLRVPKFGSTGISSVRLMQLPLTGRKELLAPEKLRTCLHEIYELSYGCHNPDQWAARVFADYAELQKRRQNE